MSRLPSVANMPTGDDVGVDLLGRPQVVGLTPGQESTANCLSCHLESASTILLARVKNQPGWGMTVLRAGMKRVELYEKEEKANIAPLDRLTEQQHTVANSRMASNYS